MKKINSLFIGFIIFLNHANAQGDGKGSFYNSKKINEKIKLANGIINTVDGAPFEGTLIIDSATWGWIEGYNLIEDPLAFKNYYYIVNDKFSSPIKFNISSGVLSGTVRDSYSGRSKDNYILINDGYNFNRSGKDFECYSEVRNGELAMIRTTINNETITKKFEKNKTISVTSSDKSKKIILNDSITKIIEYNFKEGNKNKTEVQSIHFFKDNELVQLEKYSDGKLIKQFIYDNGYLVYSKEITEYGYLLTTFDEGLAVKSEIYESVKYYNYYQSISDTNKYLLAYNNGCLNEFSCTNNKTQIKVTPQNEEGTPDNNAVLTDVKTKITKKEDQWTVEYHLVNGIISGRYLQYLTNNPKVIKLECNYINGSLEGKYIEREFDNKFKLLWESSGQMKYSERVGNWTDTSFNNGKKKVTTSTY